VVGGWWLVVVVVVILDGEAWQEEDGWMDGVLPFDRFRRWVVPRSYTTPSVLSSCPFAVAAHLLQSYL
jgi:hypothetical protein